jgi:hypothetical protein
MRYFSLIFLFGFQVFLHADEKYSAHFLDILNNIARPPALSLQDRDSFEVSTTINSADFNKVSLLFRSSNLRSYFLLNFLSTQNSSHIFVLPQASAEQRLSISHQAFEPTSAQTVIRVRFFPSIGKQGDYTLLVYLNDKLFFKVTSSLFPSSYKSCFGCTREKPIKRQSGWNAITIPQGEWVGLGNTGLVASFVSGPVGFLVGDYVRIVQQDGTLLSAGKTDFLRAVEFSRFDLSTWFKIVEYNASTGLIKLSSFDNRFFAKSTTTAQLVLVNSSGIGFELRHDPSERRSAILFGREYLRRNSSGVFDFFTPSLGSELFSLELQKVSTERGLQNIRSADLSSTQISNNGDIFLQLLGLVGLTNAERAYLVTYFCSYVQDVQKLLPGSGLAYYASSQSLARALSSVANLQGLSDEQKKTIEDLIAPPFVVGDTIKIKKGNNLWLSGVATDIKLQTNSSYAKEAHFKVLGYDKASHKLQLAWYNQDPISLGTNRLVAAAGGTPVLLDFVYHAAIGAGALSFARPGEALLDVGNELVFSLVTNQEKMLDAIALVSSLAASATTQIFDAFVQVFTQGTKTESDWTYLQTTFGSYIDSLQRLLTVSASASAQARQESFACVQMIEAAINQIGQSSVVPAGVKSFLQNKKDAIFDVFTTKMTSDNYLMFGWPSFQASASSQVLSFEARASSDIHVAFRDASNGYAEFVIGGWSNTQSALRYYSAGKLINQVLIKHPQGPIKDKNNFLKYTIALNGGRLMVMASDSVIISQDVTFLKDKIFNAYSFRAHTQFPWSMRYPSASYRRDFDLNIQSVVLDAARVTDDFNKIIIPAFSTPQITELEVLSLVNQALRYEDFVETLFDFNSQANKTNQVREVLAAGLNTIKGLAVVSQGLKDSLQQTIDLLSRSIAALKANDIVRIVFKGGGALSFASSMQNLEVVNASAFAPSTHFKVIAYDRTNSTLSLAHVLGGSVVVNSGTLLANLSSQPQVFNFSYNQSTQKAQLRTGNSVVFLGANNAASVGASAPEADTQLSIDVLAADRQLLTGLKFTSLTLAQITADIKDKFLLAFSASSKDSAGLDWRFLYDQFNSYVEGLKAALDFERKAPESLDSVNALISACTQIAAIAGIPEQISTSIAQIKTTLTGLLPVSASFKAGDVIQIKYADSALALNGNSFVWKPATVFDVQSTFIIQNYDTRTQQISFKTANGASVTITGSVLRADASSAPSTCVLEFNPATSRAAFKFSGGYLRHADGTAPAFSANAKSERTMFDVVVINQDQQRLGSVKKSDISLVDLKKDVATFTTLFAIDNKTPIDWTFLIAQFNEYLRLALAAGEVKNNLMKNVPDSTLSYYDHLLLVANNLKKTTISQLQKDAEAIIKLVEDAATKAQVFAASLTKPDVMTQQSVVSDFKDKIIPNARLLVDQNSEWASFANTFKNYVTALKNKNADWLNANLADGLTIKTYTTNLLKLIFSSYSAAPVEVKQLMQGLYVDLFGSVDEIVESNFLTVDFPSAGKIIIRRIDGAQPLFVKGIPLVADAAVSRYTKEAHYAIVSYNKESRALVISSGSQADLSLTLEPVLLKEQIVFAFKDASGNYLLNSERAKQLFSITLADPLELLFDELSLPAAAADISSRGDLFLRAFDLLKSKPEDAEQVCSIFERFVNALMGSPLWAENILDGFSVKNYIRSLGIVFLGQSSVVPVVRDKILALLAQNTPIEEAKKTVIIETKKEEVQAVSFSLPDGSLTNISADIALYGKAFEAARNSTKDLSDILNSCTDFVQKGSLRLDWVYSEDASKPAHRIAFIATLNTLLQPSLASYYSGLTPELRKKVLDLIKLADNDKPTYALQLGNLDVVAAKITAVSGLVASAEIHTILKRLASKIAIDGDEAIQRLLIEKIDGYFTKDKIPALASLAASDKAVGFAWRNLVCDRLIEAFALDTFSATTIGTRVSWIKDIISTRLQSSVFDVVERRSVGRKFAGTLLAKASPLVKNATKTVKDDFRNILILFETHSPGAVETLWRIASVTKPGVVAQGNNRGGSV